ncbi:cysteine hydrolase family protein [Limosilactobacillus vaginalis]|uniref:cysteine hydrolase family protein n=1 Tax=Limosilactobacillus vaginalis TaxID=1633 RepID=UPI00241EA169|nr:cysteine hydrolase family protein [Limosilactobacillus vaginalis]
MTKALLVIDLQNGVCYKSKEIFNLKSLIKLINERIAFFRAQDLPVVFIQHESSLLLKGSTEWKLISELNYQRNDFYINKTHPNSFYKTTLQETLNSLQVRELEICGAQTEYCVDTTIKMAHGLGYQLSMRYGASSTFDNQFMTAKETIQFYENIWEEYFLDLF